MLLLLIINVLLLHYISAQKVCTKFWVRKEWRELTGSEINSFFNAIKCLKSKPSKYDSSLGSPSIYDDMVYIHIFSHDVAHKVAAFLPWHRQFLSIFENLLRNECGYDASVPYWDFAMDSQAPERSPVFGKNAFGGNGGPNGCITDGAFTNWGSTFPQKKDCITRQYNLNSEYGHLMGAQYSPLQIEYMLLYYKKFSDFGKVIEDHPHNMAHYGIGGTFFDPKTAANDPIFWIVHTNVDRIWYTWQKRYPELANSYNGNTRLNSTVEDATANDMLRYYGLGEDVRVRDTFSTESLRYCYVYSNSIMPIKTGRVSKRSINLFNKFKLQNLAQNTEHVPVGFLPKVEKNHLPLSDAGLAPVGVFGKQAQFLEKSAYLGPFDRTSDPYKLRKAIQFPDDFLHKKYSPETVARIREREQIFSVLVDEANRNNFVSPAALANIGSWAPATTSDLVSVQVKMNPFKRLFSTITERVKSRFRNLINS